MNSGKTSSVEWQADPKLDRPLKTLGDRDLLRRIDNGSQEAFRELWYRIRSTYSARISRWCWYDLNDIVQAVTVNVVEEAHRWIPWASRTGTTAAFASREVNRLVQQVYRANKKSTPMPDEAGDPRQASPEQLLLLIEEFRNSQAVQKALTEELGNLSSKHRDCLVSKLIDGVPVKDLAIRYAVDVRQIQRYLKAALNVLSKKLAQRGIVLPAALVGVLLSYHADAAAVECRVMRLTEAMPSLTSGKGIPDGAMTPNAKAIYLLSKQSVRWHLFSGYTGTSLALLALPVIGMSIFAFWSTNLRPERAADSTEMRTDEMSNKGTTQSDQGLSHNLRASAEEAGRFPQQPVPGQVHKLMIAGFEEPIAFCWVPGGTSKNRVSVSGFWMCQTEITQPQWRMFKDQNQDFDPSFFYGDKLPVEQVSYEEVIEYAKRFATHAKVPVRLPTIDEWQVAASAGVEDRKPDTEALTRYAWFDENSDNQTHDVAKLQPNPWNLYDLFGNVREFALAEETLENDRPTIPILGASWSYPPIFCQPYYPAFWHDPSKSDSGTGFRLIYNPSTDRIE